MNVSIKFTPPAVNAEGWTEDMLVEFYKVYAQVRLEQLLGVDPISCNEEAVQSIADRVKQAMGELDKLFKEKWELEYVQD